MKDTVRRDEDDAEIQRERYQELLHELRTMIPGVEVLLGVLLTVPFSSRFAELDALGARLFLATLLSAAAAVIAFLVPSVYHRLTPHTQRGKRLRVGIRSIVVGLALLGAAIVTATFVVARFIFSTRVGIVSAALLAVLMLGLWVALPLLHRTRDG